MAKALKRKVKGSVNISQHDLWGTSRSVGDFRKTGEVTWKGTAEFGSSEKGSWHWLSSKLVDFPAPWNSETRESPWCVNGVEAPESCRNTIISYLMLNMFFPALLESSQCLSNISSPLICTPFGLAMWQVFSKWTGHWIFSQSIACVHPCILDEHKVACSQLLLYCWKKGRLETGSCAEVRSDEFCGMESCWEGACFENPVAVIQYNRAKTSENTWKIWHQGRLEAGSFPLC